MFLVPVISLPAGRFGRVLSSNLCIEVSTITSVLVSYLPPSFLDTYNQSTSSLGCKALYLVISFLLLWSICLGFSLVFFKYSPEYIIIIVISACTTIFSSLCLSLYIYLYIYIYIYIYIYMCVCVCVCVSAVSHEA